MIRGKMKYRLKVVRVVKCEIPELGVSSEIRKERLAYLGANKESMDNA